MRRLTRLALHWLVVLSMIATTVVVPAQAADEVLQAAAASAMAAAMDDMPCADEAPANTDHEMPCDCCTPSNCGLSACLGTACLPELPRLVAAIPPTAMPVPWTMPAPTPARLDTLLRPPIA